MAAAGRRPAEALYSSNGGKNSAAKKFKVIVFMGTRTNEPTLELTGLFTRVTDAEVFTDLKRSSSLLVVELAERFKLS
jgi:hypothetical protein